jgi:hypothetical protein
LRTHFLAFILSFGKFWRALQKILRETALTHFHRSDAHNETLSVGTMPEKDASS